MVLIGTDTLHDGLRFPFGLKSGGSITLFAGIRAIKRGDGERPKRGQGAGREKE